MGDEEEFLGGSAVADDERGEDEEHRVPHRVARLRDVHQHEMMIRSCLLYTQLSTIALLVVYLESGAT